MRNRRSCFIISFSLFLIYLCLNLFLSPSISIVWHREEGNGTIELHQLGDKQVNLTGISLQEVKNENILRILYRHINETAARLTRVRMAGFNPLKTLLVYAQEENSTSNQTYTETRQSNGQPWIKPTDTCAVIGNSGIMTDSNCGVEIDAHDYVFRSNMAHIEGFEKDVGTKTTLVTINSDGGRYYSRCSRNMDDSCYDFVKKYLRKLDNSTIIWVTKGSSRYTKMSTVRALRSIKPEVVIARPSRLLNSKVARVWNISKPSSGLYLLSLAEALCNKISVYGFYPFNQSRQGKPIKYHYYEESTFENAHNIPAEFKVLEMFNKSGVLRLVTSQCFSVNL